MISDATTKKATDQAVLSADWVGIERLFTGKFRQYISHAPTSRRSASSQHTDDTIMVLMISTAAFCPVLKTAKYRDVMGARVRTSMTSDSSSPFLELFMPNMFSL